MKRMKESAAAVRTHEIINANSRIFVVSTAFSPIETYANKFASKSLRFLVLFCLWLSRSEPIDRPDPACPSQILLRAQSTSTDLSSEESVNLIDDATYKFIELDIPDSLRGGHSDSTLTSSDPNSFKSSILDLNAVVSNNDLNQLPYDNVSELGSLTFSVIQSGDGSQSDPDGIPTRFLLMQKGNREHAIQALKATKAWREKHMVDSILSRPHPNYDVYKAIFPVFLAGRDPTGHIIVVEQLGKINDEIAKRKNIAMDEVLFHFVFMVEYCWNILDRPPHRLPSMTPTVISHDTGDSLHPNHLSPGSMITIFDCQGVTISSILGLGKAASENRKFLIRFVQTISDHYPLRSYKTLIVNAPNWVHGIYFNLVRPLLRESSREKIKLFQGGKEQQDALNELGLHVLIEDENKLVSTHQENGTSEDIQSIARKSSMERDLRDFVQDILRKSGRTMNTVQ